MRLTIEYCPDPTRVLRNTRNMPYSTFLKSKKFKILKHTWSPGFVHRSHLPSRTMYAEQAARCWPQHGMLGCEPVEEAAKKRYSSLYGYICQGGEQCANAPLDWWIWSWQRGREALRKGVLLSEMIIHFEIVLIIETFLWHFKKHQLGPHAKLLTTPCNTRFRNVAIP